MSFDNNEYMKSETTGITHFSKNNNDQDMDSCISLRPLGSDKSATEIMNVASSSSFVAPSLIDMKKKSFDIKESPKNLNKFARKGAQFQQRLLFSVRNNIFRELYD